MVRKIGILVLFFILLFFSYAEAKDAKVIRISVVIPAIIGLNAPETASSEDKIITPDGIIQTEQREEGQVILKTVLLK